MGVKIWGIEVYSIYAPHGDLRGLEKYYYKLKWYKAFIEFIKSRRLPVVLAGDFNIAPEDIDVYNPEILCDTIGTMAEEIEQIKNLVSIGFIDTFRHLHPDSKMFSWWDYTGGDVWKDHGMRIDYIFCSHSLRDSIKGSTIDTWPRKRKTPILSDHTPVITDFVI